MHLVSSSFSLAPRFDHQCGKNQGYVHLPEVTVDFRSELARATKLLLVFQEGRGGNLLCFTHVGVSC